MQLTSNAEIDQLHVMSIFKKPFQGFKQSRESNEALHSEQRDGERLSRNFLNLCMFSEVICNRFTEDAYLPRVMCTVFGFAR